MSRCKYYGRVQGRGGREGPDPPVKSQVAIGFLRNSGTDPLREAMGPIASQERSVRPSVKYVEMTKNRKENKEACPSR